MRPPRDEWLLLLQTLEAQQHLIADVVDQRPPPGVLSRYNTARSKLEELKEYVWSSEDCEKP